MKIPTPRPGLVLNYSYVWWDEARRGQSEGRKDRPCVVVLSVRTIEGETIVTIAPITHSVPGVAGYAVELSASTKRRLGLDARPSWVVCDDLNSFTWPGFDLRPIGRGADIAEFGVLPTALLARIRDRVVAAARARIVRTTNR